ncbi:MAG: beta-ketoacyl synthase chain length factor [Bacteroidales bacterium]|nr:beta-ketoacyl synthase chain length factor [Bacteroidales bacterium]
MPAFIKSSCVISPQHTHHAEGFPAEMKEVVANRLSCEEPDYKSLINPLQLRRMPRILKMGLAASQLCINRAGGVSPDGIVVGTGLGCLDNLEKFLLEVLDNNEHVTSVLPFINSTHNAVAAQIAMLLKNHNYNVTYCHRAFSFESALLDALMLLQEKQAHHVLVGGIDECTSDFVHLHSYLGQWKEPLSNFQLLSGKSPGTIAGEGSAFFMISDEVSGGGNDVNIAGIHTFLTSAPADMTDVVRESDLFLEQYGLRKQDMDTVLLGLNGDSRNDGLYHQLMEHYFDSNAQFLYYKHLCGEYYTSSAFALWLASAIMQSRSIPDVVSFNSRSSQSPENLLIYNLHHNTEHSLILLRYGRL